MLGVINTWLDTLLDFIEFLPVDCLQREVNIYSNYFKYLYIPGYLL